MKIHFSVLATPLPRYVTTGDTASVASASAIPGRENFIFAML